MSEALVFLTVVVNAVLGFLIFFRSRKASENLFYALFVFFLDFWILANFLENEPGKVGLEQLALFLRLDFLLAPLVMYFWLRFCIALGIDSGYRIRWSGWISWIGAGLAAVLVPLTLFTPLIIKDIQFYDSVVHFKDGKLFPLYALFLLACLIGGPLILFMIRRFARRMENEQLAWNVGLILVGFVISFGNAILINLFQPFLPVTLEISRVGIYGLTVLVIFTAYAMIRHQFLNVKVIAVEAFAICLVIFSAMQVPDLRLPYIMVLRAFILLGTLIVSVFIVRSVRQEVRQREELEMLTKKLAEANRSLGELSRFKSQLLSLASHQIKSPLAIIKGYLAILLDGLYGPLDAKVRATLEKVKKSADGLTELIEDLLSLRKVEEGRMDYRFAFADLRNLAEDVVEDFRVLAYQKGILLEYEGPENPLVVECDDEKLREAFRNLVDNSIKYTPKGFVRVAMGVAGAKARFSVKDSGIGISAELLPRLFAEFIRDERVRKDIKGTGFGLYLAKKIVEAHGGRIWAESEGEGKGSVFIVELPLSSPK